MYRTVTYSVEELQSEPDSLLFNINLVAICQPYYKSGLAQGKLDMRTYPAR